MILNNWHNKETNKQVFLNILQDLDFKLIKDKDNNFRLEDLTDVNLGNIHNEIFYTSEDVFERLDTYIENYYINEIIKETNINYSSYLDLIEQLQNINTNNKYDYEIKVLDFICNAPEIIFEKDFKEI